MTTKTASFPLSKNELDGVAKDFGTPFYIYDEKAIRKNMQSFAKAFSCFQSFKEFFALKALPNPYILKILKEEGCGADCSSLPELILAKLSGMKGEDVIFTSNQTPEAEYIYAATQGNIINLDDVTHIEFLKKIRGGNLPKLLCFRYNPGSQKKSGTNAIIGKPQEAKYGITKEQVLFAYQSAKQAGVKRFGLHTMVASNELDVNCFAETAKLVFDVAVELKEKLDIRLEFVDLGGGVGIPYRPGQKAVDYEELAKKVKEQYEKIIVPKGLSPLSIYWECGRPITGPYGYLVTRAIHKKHIYREYIGVDATMACLMRPGMYGAYHHISVAGKDDVIDDEGNITGNAQVVDVVGSLCENCDKFAVQRPLPPIDIGDLLIIYDAGAHGLSMGFNYNGKLRCKELLRRCDGSIVQIRRAETIDDYFATLDLQGVKTFV